MKCFKRSLNDQLNFLFLMKLISNENKLGISVVLGVESLEAVGHIIAQ